MCIASVSSSVAIQNEKILREEMPLIIEIQNIPPSFMMRVHEKNESALATEPDDFEGCENETIKGKVCRLLRSNNFY